MKEMVVAILTEILSEDGQYKLSNEFLVEKIEYEEFDSLKMADFMMQIEETFQVYIDEESMEKIDFTQTYQILVDDIVNILQELVKENVS